VKSIKELISEIIEKYIKQKGYPDSSWLIEVPKDRSMADYASNIAFTLAKTLKKSPLKIAEEMALELATLLGNTDLEGTNIFSLNGFVNFILPAGFCFEYISSEDFSQNAFAGKERVLLEYVSANPTGPLHIGHGRWAALGDSLRRLLAWTGYKVDTEFYINDAGSQINNLLNTVKALKEGKAIPENGYAGSYVKDLLTSQDPVEEILNAQKQILATFRVEFDTWFSEKKGLHDKGLVTESIEQLKLKNLTYVEGGAVFFKSTQYGDDKDRVLIKENGEYTYLAADVAYHLEKIKRGYKHLINIWGADHHGYINRIKAAITAFAGEDAVLEVLLGQLVTLYRNGEEVRMSKRTGDMISLEEVMEEIGVDATRFYLIQTSADNHLEFDLEVAKKQSNDNPVFYVQYAHARISSILKKTQRQAVFHKDLPLKEVETKLLKFMLYFEEEINLAAQRREPYRIARYLLDLANVFHSFYHECKVNVDDQEVSENRLALIKLTKKILANGLGLMGITAPESM